ncbi:hypothetical protein [Streptomyces winkii]|uniref:hypothetical protein n=1 Tax=Streptomyces winkii TaxID=3051178 RepID=UPI0028D037C7|nr:hypothetical protein [Streptomyces sp. DSM 40971]
MRKLREAAVVVTMVGSVSMIGAGVASACGEKEEPPPSISINCTQETGSNTVTTQTGDVNVSDALNGGDADASANQQLCGLDNEDAENTGGTATGGTGGVLGDITL